MPALSLQCAMRGLTRMEQWLFIWLRSSMREAGPKGTDANQGDLCPGKCDLACLNDPTVEREAFYCIWCTLTVIASGRHSNPACA
jgi:hypothetical protein